MRTTAAAEFARLDAERENIMENKRRMASLTIPILLLPKDIDVKDIPKSHDYQSLGAQCVNHLTNKMALAMVAPSRPAFRLQLGEAVEQEAAQLGPAQAKKLLKQLQGQLSQQEKKATRVLDSSGQRPKVYDILRHLIAIGDCLLYTDKKERELRVYALDSYVVKRTITGKMHTVIIRERLCFDELADDVQAALPSKYQPEQMVSFYICIEKTGKGYKLTQHVDSFALSDDFTTVWAKAEDCPYYALTWNLADRADYGTSLVEYCLGDFEALSALSEAIVNGAVLASEFRWALDPTSQTSADDLKESQNGDVIAARKDDIAVIQAATATAVQITSDIAERWEQRLARTFLLMSAVTRNAERVTAEEIRQLAQELETALGGTYSHLSATVMPALVNWMLAIKAIKVNGKTIELEIITGLDALSRAGDLEALKACLTDMALLAQLPPMLLQRLKLDAVSMEIANGHGIDFEDFLMTEDEFKAMMAEAVQQNATNAGAVAGAEAQAEASAQPGAPA